MIACENSGHEVAYNFTEVSKIIEVFVASKRKTKTILTIFTKPLKIKKELQNQVLFHITEN